MTAPAPTLVRVTAGHIEAGRVADCRLCPVARAVKDAIGMPGAVVDAYASSIIVWPAEVDALAVRRAHTPFEVREFIGRFDNGLPVAPFEFELTWLEEA